MYNQDKAFLTVTLSSNTVSL